MHSRSYVHRDLKPENFLLGSGKRSNSLFIIDFGLAKRYISPKDGKHIKNRQKLNPTGTMRYCSVQAQQAYEYGRRDDMISLAHILIYLLNGGELPWMNESDPRKCIAMKQSMNVADISKRKLSANAVTDFYQKVTSLKFEDKPNYRSLKAPFL